MRRGVRDSFPNYFDINIQHSSANTYTTIPVNLPIARVTSGSRTATIIELLWASCTPVGIDFNANDDSINFSLYMGPPQDTHFPIEGVDSYCIFNVRYDTDFTTSGMWVSKFPHKVNLQSKDGFGFLVASDKINAAVLSSGEGGAVDWRVRVYYRFVTVGIEEYIGIVQSQS